MRGAAFERAGRGRHSAGMNDDTLAVAAGRDPARQSGAVNPPVVRASTIAFPTVAALEAAEARKLDAPYYGRHGTPTAFAFEEAAAALEGGYRSVTLASGKAAVLAALTAFVESGDHMLVADSAYAPTRAYCLGFLKRFGVETTFYDPRIGAGVAALIRPETKLVFAESPGSLTFEVQDLPALASAARAAGCAAIVDNSWASPLFFKPFDHGADVSIQAATKYIGGHSDLMLGVVTTTRALHEKVRTAAFALGAPAGPDDIYLAQRGLRTLPVRMRRHMESGLAVARWLRARPQVARVLHPALEDDPGHALWRRDFTGASGLFGVELVAGPKRAVAALLDGLELFAMGFSWGGYESLAIPVDPARSRSATRALWEGAGPMLRLHVGLEDPGDLIADLAAGLARYDAARGAAA